MSVLGMQEVACSATKVRELVDFGPFPPDFGSILGQECLRDYWWANFTDWFAYLFWHSFWEISTSVHTHICVEFVHILPGWLKEPYDDWFAWGKAPSMQTLLVSSHWTISVFWNLYTSIVWEHLMANFEMGLYPRTALCLKTGILKELHCFHDEILVDIIVCFWKIHHGRWAPCFCLVLVLWRERESLSKKYSWLMVLSVHDSLIIGTSVWRVFYIWNLLF